MSPSQAFILDYEGPQGEVLQYLLDLLLTFPDMTTKIRYRIPFFYRKSWICYLNPTKNGKVELAFTRGNELSNANGLLDAKGRSQVMGVEFSKVSDIPEEALVEVIQEAIMLDDTVPYASKRKKKK